MLVMRSYRANGGDFIYSMPKMGRKKKKLVCELGKKDIQWQSQVEKR